MTSEDDGARNLFYAKLISQRADEEGDTKDGRERGRGKTQQHPEANKWNIRRDLHAMNEWTEAQPPCSERV